MFLGLDGGQTSTVALIADESGRVIGTGRGGGCDHTGTDEGRARFREAVGKAVQAALRNAQLSGATEFRAACFGLSGGTLGREELVRELVRAQKYLLTTDALIALTGALAGEPGIIAIAGTGSIGFGRNVIGKLARAGGWGYVFGDEGGAFEIVRQALRAALRNEEGWGPDTHLRAVLQEATGVDSMNDLLHRFYTPEYPRSRIASYAKLVDQAALQGDAVAREIMNAAAQALATLVAAVRRQLFHRSETPGVSFIGGVFASQIVRERFALLVELEGVVKVHAPAYGPAEGALMEAFRLAGLQVQPHRRP